MKKKKPILGKYLIAAALTLAFLATLFYMRIQIQGVQEINSQPSPTPTATATPTPISEVRGTSTTKPQAVNKDPIITCNISSNCGGGSRQMKKSECDQTTCCQIGNNWYFYLSKDKCIQDQKSVQPQQVVVQQAPVSNKVPVFISYGGYTMYCPQQNVSAVQSISSTMESKKTEWAKNFNTCADNFYKTDPCYVACHDTETNQLNACYAQYGYSGPDYTICTNSAFDGYGTCIKTCPSVSQACDYVYWELKSLSNQINDLCK